MRLNRRFRKSERKRMAQVLGELLGREVSVEKIAIYKEIVSAPGCLLVTGREKVVLIVQEK